MTDFQVFNTDGSAHTTVESASAAPQVACAALERGGIVYFPLSPFPLPQGDIEFLLNQKQLETAYHKNIAYRPLADKLTGIKADSGTDTARVAAILKSYSEQVVNFMTTFTPPYKNNWRLDYASFRPVEEQGRKMRLRARNDLLHVDSFPTRPTYGDRILRVFTNIHPTQVRVWKTSDPFPVLAGKFQSRMKPLRKMERRESMPFYVTMARKLGFKMSNQSGYDTWMMDFHNFLKENTEFQETTRTDIWKFPPGSSWMVYTDMVSHAVLAGQHALEQTFIIEQGGLVLPDLAPVNVLNRLYNMDSMRREEALAAR